MTEIICISATGKAKSSRETAARLLRDALEKEKKRVLITRIADPLKMVCRNWFDWNGKMDDAGRAGLRYIGTDIVRARQPNFWIDFTLGLLSILGSEWDFVIIPDCRYPSEFDMERFGFYPRHLRIGSLGSLGNSLDKIFALIGNDSPEQLRGDIADAAHRLIYG